MGPGKDLVGYYFGKISKSLKYLEYSFHRTNQMGLEPDKLSPEEFEAWDSFASRFARTSDLFLSKYIKAFVKNDDPAFDGGFRDFLHRAEKLNLIEEISPWLDIRDLRNVAVHDYSDSDLAVIFAKFRKYTPLLLELPKRIPAQGKSQI